MSLVDVVGIEGGGLVETPKKRSKTVGAPCIFYRSSQGCREGDLCPWLHEKGFMNQSKSKRRRMRAERASPFPQKLDAVSFDVEMDNGDFDSACNCVLEPLLEGVDLSELQKIARNNAGSYTSNVSSLPGRVAQLPCSDLDKGPDYSISTNIEK